ncbi:uncharacterized protein LOC126798925 isoform X3 [Argentina anserina]|uniref:uncharacterized protein LOC126798925 isoform X3 n=1 Tax=Argentina anserina TaxID=57926 RepID=UPI0021764826|nr:uncharacterized protein LOC126798925 isoform X3 [Potentilla anserina]
MIVTISITMMESELPPSRGKKIRKIKFKVPPPPDVTPASHPRSETEPTATPQPRSAAQHISSSQQAARHQPTPASQPMARTEPAPVSQPVKLAQHRIIAPQPAQASHARLSRTSQKQAAQCPTSLNSVISPEPDDAYRSRVPSPNHEIAPQQHETQNGGNSDSTTLCTKRKRGKSVGKGTLDLISANRGKKLVVVWDPDHWVPSDGKISRRFTSEIGITIRSYAPACYGGWSKIEPDIKRKLREKLEILFEVDLLHPKVIAYVDSIMSTAYTQFKWRLHDHYKKCGTYEQARVRLPHPDLWNSRPLHHWHWLCDNVCRNEDYMEICATNAQNRDKQESTHRGGAMPFIQHALQAAKESGKPVSLIDNYENMYQDAEHTWVSEAKRARHEKMKQKREAIKAKLIEEAAEGTSIESIEVSLNEEIAIMAKECGRKGGKVHGVGAFPRLDIPSSSSTPINSEWNEMKGNIQTLSSTVTTLKSENAQLKSMLRAIFTKLSGSNNINVDADTIAADGIEGRDDFPDGFDDFPMRL